MAMAADATHVSAGGQGGQPHLRPGASRPVEVPRVEADGTATLADIASGVSVNCVSCTLIAGRSSRSGLKGRAGALLLARPARWFRPVPGIPTTQPASRSLHAVLTPERADLDFAALHGRQPREILLGHHGAASVSKRKTRKRRSPTISCPVRWQA